MDKTLRLLEIGFSEQEISAAIEKYGEYIFSIFHLLLKLDLCFRIKATVEILALFCRRYWHLINLVSGSEVSISELADSIVCDRMGGSCVKTEEVFFSPFFFPLQGYFVTRWPWFKSWELPLFHLFNYFHLLK